MPKTYVAKQGQTVDLICKEHYGVTATVTEFLLAANPGVATLGTILPMGTRLTMPDFATQSADVPLTNLWD